MRPTDVPKEVLVSPTADEFLRALTESLNCYRADTETVLEPHHISLAALSGPEGSREWTLFRLTEAGREVAVPLHSARGWRERRI